MFLKKKDRILIAGLALAFALFSFPALSSLGRASGNGAEQWKGDDSGTEKKKGKSKKKGKKGKKSDPDLKEAITHFQKGVEFFNDEDYINALMEFLMSYERVPNKELRYNIGVCYLETGEPAKAAEQFHKYLEEMGEDISKDIKEEVEEMLAEIENKIGYLMVECNKEGASVKVGNVEEQKTPMKRPVPVNAGSHLVVVKKAGFETVEKEFSIKEGEKKVVKVALEALQEEPAEEEPPVELEVEEEAGKGKGIKLWMWVSALSAAAALGAGAAVTGGLALKKRNDMRSAADNCDNTTSREFCPKAYDLQKEGRTLMITTNVLAGVAGAAAITGLVLFILHKPWAIEKEGGELQQEEGRQEKNHAAFFIAGGALGRGSFIGFNAVLRY